MDIECLIEKIGADSLSTRDEWGYTPAHWAALDGNVEVSKGIFYVVMVVHSCNSQGINTDINNFTSFIG